MKILILNLIMLLAFGRAFAQEFEPTDLIIDDIECTGNTLTDCEIIKREIYLSPGSRIDEEEIKNSKIRLQLLGLFETVDLSLKKSAERGHVILEVNVLEDSPYFSETSLEGVRMADSTYTLRSQFKFGHRNLFGKGKVLQFTFTPPDLQKGGDEKRYTGKLEYVDPHLFGQTKYFASAFVAQSQLFQPEDTNYLATPGNVTTLGVNLGRRIFDFSHIGIGYNTLFGDSLVRDSVTNPFDIDRKHTSTYTLNYGWNSEDDQYFATEGSKLDLTYYLYESTNRAVSLEYNKNWSLQNPKHILTFVSDTNYSNYRYQGDYFNTTNGLVWNYQLRRGDTDKDISDIRLFVDQRFKYYKDLEGLYFVTSGGVLFDTKNFGIVKLSLFLSGSSIDWSGS